LKTWNRRFKQRSPAFGIPYADFVDAWRSFGTGSTQFIDGGGPVGIYSTTHRFIPIELVCQVGGGPKTTLKNEQKRIREGLRYFKKTEEKY
jgi:hypothetical protein